MASVRSPRERLPWLARVHDLLLGATFFGTVMTFLFVWTLADSFDWGFLAGFLVFLVLSQIADARDTILEELRKTEEER